MKHETQLEYDNYIYIIFSDLALTETEDAYILDVDLPEKSPLSSSPATRFLSSGNSALDGAVVGLGVGILGSLLLNKLEKKKKCNPIGKRDTALER